MTAKKSDFVHLHVHSEYSLLDGLGRVNDLVDQAVQNGQSALALTDHGAMHGVVEFFRACKGREVKPIIGIEAYMTLWGRKMTDKDPYQDKTRHHLLLLAQNMTGYQNLLKISSAAQVDGYYYKPRVDADFLAGHSEGLICTTGCMAAEVPYYLNGEEGRAPNEKMALERLHWYLDLFGPDRFFIELQEHSIPELTQINKTLLEWSKKYNVGLVVTNDVHYARADDASPHDTLLCVQTSALVSDPKRMRLSDQGYYLKSEAEMRDLFRPLADLPESAFTNTVKIAEMCEVALEDKDYHLPDLPPKVMPAGLDYKTFLGQLTDEGLVRRYGERANSQEVQERKALELGIINKMNFDVYFLIVWDMCEFARKNNIWWNVRGSGAGSIVAYALGITMIDPLQNGLIFERFLNPGRISMPDFDLDFPDDQREAMINYTIEKYGEDHVAQIVSFGRMKARAAIRDVGRAQGVELSEVDQIAKLVPAIPGKPVTIDQVLESDHEFYSADLKSRYDADARVKALIDAARSLEGVARHASIHAAAVIVTDRPLINYVPLMRPQGSVITKAVTQFEFPICESIGLLKIDFLGLSTLTIMRKAAELIQARHGITYNLDNIPIEDPKAFALLASGNVTGIFQVEGAGMRRILTSMRPSKFEHIIAVLALYRPGPMQYIPNYVARMHGEEAVSYRQPMLEPILSETYGIIVYQEQIMRIATDLAGYTASEADFMRKAVAKKQEKDLLKHKDKMVQGGLEQGVPEQSMLDIFSDIEAFARYGFPKGHAADYAVITCQTAFLKAYYPVEYMTAMLTVERNNTDKIGQLLDECRAMGIKVLPPNVNKSGSDFLIEDDPDGSSIRFGLGAVKNVGTGPIEAILCARDEPFETIDDFCQRVDLRKVGKRALESLIKVGALDDFGPRAQFLAVIDRMTRLSTTTHQAVDVGQTSLFDIASFDVPITGSILDPMPDVEEIKQRVWLGWEKELVGTYISAHPLDGKMAEIRAAVTCLCGDLDELQQGRKVIVAGLINKVRHTSTKKGDTMAFIEIEDTQGTLEVIVFPRTFAAYQHLLITENLVVVSGKVDARDEGRPKVLAETISTELTSYHPAGGDSEANDRWETVVEETLLYPLEPEDNQARPVEPPEPPQDDWVNEPKPLLFILPRAHNLDEDIQKLRTVYHLLEDHPGGRKFELCIPQNGIGVLIEYELGIQYDPTLKQKLHQLGVTIRE